MTTIWISNIASRLSMPALLLLWLVFRFTSLAWAADLDQPLPADEAFQLTADLKNPQTLRLSWDIADGYYLYRQKFRFASQTPGVMIGEPLYPAGPSKQDRYFGEVEIYRQRLALELPIHYPAANPGTLTLEVTFQGCSDAGICYLPVQKMISLDTSD